MKDLIELLNLIERHLPNLSERIDKETEYPNQDDFTNPADYDKAVDEAELTTLIEIIRDELV